jgi:hypothetical protein
MGLALEKKKSRKREHRAMADVKVVNLTKKYGRYTAVDNISFSCKDGEFKLVTSKEIKADPGQVIWLEFKSENIHTFHRETGANLIA